MCEKMTFGKRLTNLREAKGLTKTELAKKIGVSKTMINQYEKDKSDPRLFILICLSDALNVSLDFLARGDRNEV